ncbi:disease resistance protein TAO1 isoform X1 [Cryptomeria japonica]|uniref:disease resistance protein TAO1 isoform X1 n=2 Tax=Cryptomeria japonica TaxID=3369 RepID=UPI0027DA2EF7|nr:disease resistance protein TAO1 isoform X1 [Cryptomeria japonica]XP_057863889.2 disease resistance protein TAO1 isoform X1 [Cryptomeria japonica]XP_057863896.2 disease resistance protein TAO1 isoform X1 [Cryptomeria japonica]XP_057863901.2 disease resistance protein TAO1 isoform X1 [Cryptomeria japonica]
MLRATFQRLPNSIGCLKELKKIVIKGGNVRSLPEEFCLLQLLEHLELLSCGMLSSLPSKFGDLTNLRYLDLSRCMNLRRLPVSFKNLMLLQHLNLQMCRELILMSDDFQNITKLEFLRLSECKQLEELPSHITNQASLRELYLDGVVSLNELPIKIGQLSKLRKVKIRSELLISLPNSLGYLSSLTDLLIEDCSNLESLPTSLGDLFSLTDLRIQNCPKLKCLPFSVGRLNLLEHLNISWCPISQVDFGVASSSFALSNLKWMKLEETELCKISISEDRYPLLKTLQFLSNYHLVEIEALPASVECLYIRECPKLEELPSFARLTSFRKFVVRGCNRIEKIEGLKYCTRLEILRLHTCWEVPGIESLQQMEKLRRLELKANKGSAIDSCIQRVQKWPDGVIICTRAFSDASSVVDSLLLSPNLILVDSFSRRDFYSVPELLQKHSYNGNTIMLCYIINCVSVRQMEIYLEQSNVGISPMMEIEEGRWA